MYLVHFYVEANFDRGFHKLERLFGGAVCAANHTTAQLEMLLSKVCVREQCTMLELDASG